jgi:hypothetical protein
VTAIIIPFPTARRSRSHPRLRGDFAIVVTCDGLGGWYVIRGSHGWLHGDIAQAFEDAQEMASADSVAVVVRPPVFTGAG